MSTPKSLTFVALPLKVRNRVYQLVLLESNKMAPYRVDSAFAHPASNQQATIHTTSLNVALLLVNKQINRELPKCFTLRPNLNSLLA